jgi:hypothetical protein
MHKKHLFYCIIFICLACITGCYSIGRKFSSGAVGGAKEDIDSLTYKAAKGAVLGATDSTAQARLLLSLDSLLNHLGSSSGKSIANIRDSLISLRDSVFGKYLLSHVSQLRDSITGQPLVDNLEKLKASLLNSETNEKLKQMLAGLIDAVFSDSTNKKTKELIAMLGQEANHQATMLIDSALARIDVGYKKLGKGVKDDLTFLQRNTTGFLLSSAGIIVGAIGLVIFFFRRKKKFEQLTDLLTYQIHLVKNEQQFKDLKYRISNEAKKKNLEPMLREVLEKKGILGEKSRQSVLEEK